MTFTQVQRGRQECESQNEHGADWRFSLSAELFSSKPFQLLVLKWFLPARDCSKPGEVLRMALTGANWRWQDFVVVVGLFGVLIIDAESTACKLVNSPCLSESTLQREVP